MSLFFGCSSTKSGRYVRIGHPYNVEQIQKLYNVTQQEIENYNVGKSLTKGTWVFVPRPVGILMSARYPSNQVGSSVGFIWPLNFGNINISSDFGYRGFSHHDGIDVPAPRKTPIIAAAKGRVITSSRLKGYGKTVIINHGNGIETLYAHNSSNVVSVGDVVERGEVIAYVGATGKATGNHLHFEVRVQGKPKDPLSYLPQNRNIAFQ